ncbi:MAG: hypothetical protein DHS20C10_01340 [marine bacterium B5-7]|nr:MAG: hypothetical protein DHS20C10_01340 [marine bacterium B5-7]
MTIDNILKTLENETQGFLVSRDVTMPADNARFKIQEYPEPAHFKTKNSKKNADFTKEEAEKYHSALKTFQENQLNPIEQAKALYNLAVLAQEIWAQVKIIGLTNIDKKDLKMFGLKIPEAENSQETTTEKPTSFFSRATHLVKNAASAIGSPVALNKINTLRKELATSGWFLGNRWIPIMASDDSLAVATMMQSAVNATHALLSEDNKTDKTLDKTFSLGAQAVVQGLVSEYYKTPIQQSMDHYRAASTFLNAEENQTHITSFMRSHDQLSGKVGVCKDLISQFSADYSENRKSSWDFLAQQLTSIKRDFEDARHLPSDLYVNINNNSERPSDRKTASYIMGVEKVEPLAYLREHMLSAVNVEYEKLLKLEDQHQEEFNNSTQEDMSAVKENVEKLLEEIENFEYTALEAQESITPSANQEIPAQDQDDSDDDQFVDAVEDLGTRSRSDTGMSVYFDSHEEQPERGVHFNETVYVSENASSFNTVTQALKSAEVVEPDASAEAHEIPDQVRDDRVVLDGSVVQNDSIAQDQIATQNDNLSRDDLLAIWQKLKTYADGRKGFVADHLSTSRQGKLELADKFMTNLTSYRSSGTGSVKKSELLSELEGHIQENKTQQKKSYFFSSKPDTLGKLLEAEASKLRPGNR